MIVVVYLLLLRAPGSGLYRRLDPSRPDPRVSYGGVLPGDYLPILRYIAVHAKDPTSLIIYVGSGRLDGPKTVPIPPWTWSSGSGILGCTSRIWHLRLGLMDPTP